MGIYGLVIMAWVWWRLPETLHPEFRQPIRIGAIARNMGATLADRSSVGYVLGSVLLLGVGWGYIQSSQQLVAEHFGAGDNFPLIFGAMALTMALSNFTNSRIVERFGARRVSHAALFAYIAVTSTQYVIASTGRETLWEFVILQSLTMMLMGFVGANFGSISLQPFARIAGAAASVQAFVRMVGASLLGWWIGQSFDGTPMPFSNAALVSGMLALALVLWSEKGRLFRRLYPPGTPRPGL
jgi:DHA1 family bicyclomycin/chloramphenicol resistance-like MFS transporter